MCIRDSNEADQMVYQCDKILSENGDKINESDKKDVEDKLNALKAVSYTHLMFKDGLMQRGLIIRHLVLPGNTAQSVKILKCCLLYTSRCV